MSIQTLHNEGSRFEFERTFCATAEQLFKAYTTDKLLKQWWAPAGWEMPKCKIVLKKEGYWHFSLKCKDKENEAYGYETWGLAKYEHIEETRILSYYDYVSDKQGRINRQISAPLVTIHFVAISDGKAKMHIVMQYEQEADLKRVLELGLETALNETYEKLDKVLAK